VGGRSEQLRYFLFLNSFVPFLSVMYWNPFSISFASSSIMVDVRHM